MEFNGTDFLVKAEINGETKVVGCARSDSITINNEAIDSTCKEVGAPSLADYGYIQSPHTAWWYKGSTDTTFYNAFKSTVAAMGAQIAYIPSQVESDWVVDNIAISPVRNTAWISYVDPSLTGNFTWDYGEPKGFEVWGPNEPSADANVGLQFRPAQNPNAYTWNAVSDEASLRTAIIQIKDPSTLTEAQWAAIIVESGLPEVGAVEPFRNIISGGIRSSTVNTAGVVGSGYDTHVFSDVMDLYWNGKTVLVTVESGAGDSFSGLYFCTSCERSGEHTDAEQYSCTFESAGEITYSESGGGS